WKGTPFFTTGVTQFPQLLILAPAITVMGMFHGLVLHKSLDPDIDINACGDAMRALYQGLFHTSADGA
ncbi:MAG: hypothetical protein O2913_04585, partial [Chloroflexi bacterium]|nr:hypothetical protein [Chloroflexota bacterium]